MYSSHSNCRSCLCVSTPDELCSTRVQKHDQRFISQLLGQRPTQPRPCGFIQQILNRTHAGIGVGADLSDRHFPLHVLSAMFL